MPQAKLGLRNLPKIPIQHPNNMANQNIALPSEVRTILDKVQSSNQRTVIMTCGISGSGKSALSRNILSSYPNFTRLSIDKIIFEKHGVYGVDYSPSIYSDLQAEAEKELKVELEELLNEGERDAVLDLSKERREEYREFIGRMGKGRYGVLLVVFRVEGGMEREEEVLWGMIEGRRMQDEIAVGKGERRDGVIVSRERLGVFIRGFEWPDGEGEVVVRVQ
jgi:hypothetical protein